MASVTLEDVLAFGEPRTLVEFCENEEIVRTCWAKEKGHRKMEHDEPNIIREEGNRDLGNNEMAQLFLHLFPANIDQQRKCY